MSVVYENPTIVENDRLAPVLPASPPPVPPRRPRRGRRAWLAAIGLAGVVVLGAAVESIPPGTPGHQIWTNLVGGGVAAAAPGVSQPQTTPVGTQPQTDPQLAAIQQIIQQANNEQAEAIASQNPSIMSDTATAAHYQQLVQINQQLQAGGVTAIRLTNLTWGPITVNGNTATATSYETWVTTFSDSSTMQSTDTNVYTLVLQNGNWLISDDQQPNSSPTGPASSTSPTTPQNPATPAQPQTTTPSTGVNPADTSTSRNWAGYVAAGQSYTSVSGTWTIPQPSSNPSTAGVGATWVGIGGVSTRDLIQAGTQDVSSGGQSQFQAWIETLPQPSQQVPLAVTPGDSVTVSITEQSAGSGVWNISFKNNTTGQAYQTTVHYMSSQSSAEWIEEAPSAANRIVPLDSFGTIPFSAATTTANGQTIDLSQAGAQPVTMVNPNGQALAIPSGIASDGFSFSVARTSAPATPVPTSPRSPGSQRSGFGG